MFTDRVLTGHLWSLSVEEMFYLLWPFVFVYFKNLRVKIAIVVIIVAFFVRIILSKFHVQVLAELLISQRADALMIGCLTAIFYDLFADWIKCGRSNLKAMFSFVALGLSLALPSIIEQLNLSHFYYFVNTHYIIAVLGSLFGETGLVSDLLIACVMVASINIKNYFYYFMNSSFMNYIGKLSYSIYLWQSLFIFPILPGVSSWPVYAKLLAILTAANFTYYFVERPALKFKERFEGPEPVRNKKNVLSPNGTT